jgi:isochorismate synthase
MPEPDYHGRARPESMTFENGFHELPATFKSYSTRQLKEALLHAAVQLDAPLAFYRLPGEKNSRMMIQLQGEVCYQPLSLETSPRGFAVSSFLPDQNGAALIRSELEFLFDESLGVHMQSKEDTLWLSNFLSAVEANLTSEVTKPFFSSTSVTTDSDYPLHFKELVGKAITGIRKGKYQKVVVSRSKQINLPRDFNLITSFQKLTELYPDSFVSLVFLPGKGTWLGASPELLLRYQPKQQLSTMALAGTQSELEAGSETPINWGEKEKTEQEMVSQFIRDCFELLGVENFREEKPITLQTGHLLHLCTLFQLPLSEQSNPSIASRLLDLLHPTPAVCGTPRNEALQFLQREEGYDRELYSGFLGPVDAAEGSQLFVNLRCMQLFEHSAWLYAGAGITKDSQPEKEWEETELKVQTMIRAL